MANKVLAILQARTSSQRLPGKVLLTIAGMPLVELAYRRASNTGISVIVATSEDQSDDLLARHLESKKIPHFRGDLNNVLKRFHDCTINLDPDDVIVRLTSDNMLPDGEFIDSLVKFLKESSGSYVRSDHTHFPYGLSVEAFYKSALTTAALETSDSYHCEHVTSYIRSKFGEKVFKDKKDYTQFVSRVTIDYFADYMNVGQMFSKVKDPINATISEILKASNKHNFKNSEKFVLGTAQLGNSYGIASIGKVDEKKSLEILKCAFENGIKTLDTARAYGESESLIGKCVSKLGEVASIVTKLDPEVQLPDKKLLKLSILESLNSLRVQKLDVLLLHRYSQMAVVEELAKFKDEGFIGKIGISVSTPEEFIEASKNLSIEHVQLPMNILDWRWEDETFKQQLKIFKSRGGTVHVRSIYLQGLLTIDDPNKWPSISATYDPKLIIDFFSNLMKERHLSIEELCIGYILGLQWVDGIVIGIENPAQITQNIKAFASNVSFSLNKTDFELLKKIIPSELLNPARWIKP